MSGVLLALIFSAVANASPDWSGTDPGSCEEALATGSLPWPTLRRVRELALAHVQVAHQLGASDLRPPRVAAFYEPHQEAFTAWVEITHPNARKHYVRVILDNRFRIVLAHVEGHPGNRAARVFLGWDKVERRAREASFAWSGERPPRLTMIFTRPDETTAALFEDAPCSEARPTVRLVPLRPSRL